jgi:hypothetical protein
MLKGPRIKKNEGRAQTSEGVVFEVGLAEDEANDASIESQGAMESGGVTQDRAGAAPDNGVIIGRGFAHERVLDDQGAFEGAQSGVGDVEDDDFGSEEEPSKFVDGHRFRAAGAGLGLGDWA